MKSLSAFWLIYEKRKTTFYSILFNIWANKKKINTKVRNDSQVNNKCQVNLFNLINFKFFCSFCFSVDLNRSAQRDSQLYSHCNINYIIYSILWLSTRREFTSAWANMNSEEKREIIRMSLEFVSIWVSMHNFRDLFFVYF